MDIIREWWAVILAFLGGAMWVGKIQREVEDLKAGKFVSNERCGERRQEIKDLTALQFASGNAQFIEIKAMVSKLQDSHNQLIKVLIEDRRDNS
jgi:hypothetical protein